MAKYIVEASDLKEGQKISTGGVRENGKLVSLFFNAVPYQEQHALSAARISYPDQNSESKQKVKGLRSIIACDIEEMLWVEVGRPAIQAGLHRLGKRIISMIKSDRDTPKASQDMDKETGIVDVEAEEIHASSAEDSAVIRFKERAG